MKKKILFIERKFWGFVSIEKVFEQIAKKLDPEKYETTFIKAEFGNSFSGVLKNLIFFRKPKADIYHITGHIHYLALILPRKNTILTVHDLGFLHIRSGLRRFVLKKLFLDLPFKKLKYVTAISEATKNEIIANTGCPPEKIRVIENPIQSQFLSGQKSEFNRDCPVILQVGTLPNKNVPNLIEALKGIKCRLRLVGKLDENLQAALEAAKIEFENVFDLDDAAMKREYENADIIAFCSTYEGFGLPVIEAQAMQKPVLTSNISPLKEVSGGGAFLADPRDVSNIREGILRIINDRGFRDGIVRKGLENIKRFEPGIIAGRYEKLYEEIIESIE
jgi:glycosyltransferase involved in cell wall biosynthesis